VFQDISNTPSVTTTTTAAPTSLSSPRVQIQCLNNDCNSGPATKIQKATGGLIAANTVNDPKPVSTDAKPVSGESKPVSSDAKSNEEEVTSVPRKGVELAENDGPTVPRKGVSTGLNNKS
jgi:hypothetical protein